MKQMEPRIATVGDNTFYIRPLPAFKAANLTGELAALVLPLVSGLAPLLDKVDSSKEGGGLMDLDVSEGGLFLHFRRQGGGHPEASADCG